ncbi:Cullin [Phlyctochytrium arcticum]|nr:Cullin [Phlyctochytrium arcticum]
MSARRPVKGTKIRPPTRRPPSETQWEDVCERLSSAIKEIYKRNAGVLSFEELYRYAYNMVLYKQGDKLYDGVKGVVTEHLQNVTNTKIVPRFPRLAPGGGMIGEGEFLKELRDVWQDHTTCMLMIRDILMYMDRVYVKAADVAPVYDMGLMLFRDEIIRTKSHPIHQNLMDTILYRIRLERDGEVIDRSSLKSVIDMLGGLNDSIGNARSGTEKTVYEIDFETRFLETTREFYKLEVQNNLRTCDASEYLRKAERRLQEEEQRVANYLLPATEPKLRLVLEEELLASSLKAVIEMENSGLLSMLAHNKLSDLSRMYSLFGRVAQGHDDMCTTIAGFIKSQIDGVNEEFGGMNRSAESTVDLKRSASEASLPGEDSEQSSLVGVQVQPIQWVEKILELQDNYNLILKTAFNTERQFETAMNSAIERSINRNRKAPEFVSLFIDGNLRKGLKGKSEEEVDQILDKTVTLFRFVEEKDIFERYYKQHLAKRLLLGRSVSEDAEKSMVSKLKIECGCQFTSKLEGMFQDVHLATELMSDYRSSLSTSVTAPKEMIDLQVKVLTSTFWPIVPGGNETCNFPSEATEAMVHFQKFYHGRHSGRRLTWLAHLGTADLKANFEKGRKELNVSTYGMVVLMGVFNKLADGQSISYEQIRDDTGITDADLKRTLQSLSVAKYKILIKSSKGKDILSTDSFKVNTSFSANLHKIKIQQISAATGQTSSTGNSLETEAERAETMDKIDEARRLQVEACIVRIMKARKSLDHNNLVAEVVKQLGARFTPNPSLVKRRIEGLIERDYLERDKRDRKIYNYLA